MFIILVTSAQNDLFGDIQFSLEEPVSGIGTQIKSNLNKFSEVVLTQLHKFGMITHISLLIATCVVSGVIAGLIIGTIGLVMIKIFRILSPILLPILEMTAKLLLKTKLGKWTKNKVLIITDLAINVVVNFLSSTIKSFV